MKKITPFLLFALLFVFSLPAEGLSKETIYWLIIHWPPMMELDASSQQITGGQSGTCLKMLQKEMPGYRHVNRAMPWNRFWSRVKAGDHTLNFMAYKNTERIGYAEFSIPASVILPNQIVMRQEAWRSMGQPPSLSLATLLQDRRYRGTLITKRSYSQDIDRVLWRYEEGSGVRRLTINDIGTVRMLMADRTDYAIEYSFVVNYLLREQASERDSKLVYLPIEETAPFYYVYVAGPKSDWGRRVIGDVNTTLRRLVPNDEYRRQQEKMYVGDQLQTVYRYYDEHLISAVRKTGGPATAPGDLSVD